MTREEAIRNLHVLSTVAHPILAEACTVGIAALRKQEKVVQIEQVLTGKMRELERQLTRNSHDVVTGAQGGWVSVDERLPEPDTDVLARRSIGMDVECYHKEAGGYWSWDEYSGKWRVTHWMPLPEPPEVEV